MIHRDTVQGSQAPFSQASPFVIFLRVVVPLCPLLAIAGSLLVGTNRRILSKVFFFGTKECIPCAAYESTLFNSFPSVGL
jgi:uncharacterized membrane protein (GlpM family)